MMSATLTRAATPISIGVKAEVKSHEVRPSPADYSISTTLVKPRTPAVTMHERLAAPKTGKEEFPGESGNAGGDVMIRTQDLVTTRCRPRSTPRHTLHQ
jgi:hypothetical protein